MTKQYRESTTFKHVFWITVIYIAAHWILLVSTGRWWDDWAYADHNIELTMKVFRQSSLPMAGIVNTLIWNIPYKYFVFGMFYAGGIFLYYILKDIELFDDRAAFWIAAMFLVIPINDARITYICFNYTLGLFCFLLAFFLSTRWRRLSGWKMVLIRVISLLILLLGFNAESTMLMVLLILFYLYYKELRSEWNWREVKQNIRKFFRAVLHYLDFLFAPIAYYFGTKILFPGYGIYAGHSYVRWSTLPRIILKSPLYAAKTLLNIGLNYLSAFYNSLVTDRIGLVFAFVAISIYTGTVIRHLMKKSKVIGDDNAVRSFRMDIFLLILGAFTFYIGLFPYLVNRGYDIPTTMEYGRDSLLLGMGCSILIYYGVQIFLNNWIREFTLVLVVILGIIHFNFAFSTWEESWYQQLQVMDEIANNQEILDNNTFIVVYNNAITTRHYQTNGNSWAVTGDQSRFFLNGVDEIKYLVDRENNSNIENDGYMMNDYDFSDTTIDGVLYVNYTDIAATTVLKEKWKELFHPDEFQNWIKEQKNITYYPVSQEESDAIVHAYCDGILTNNNLISYIKAVG